MAKSDLTMEATHRGHTIAPWTWNATTSPSAASKQWSLLEYRPARTPMVWLPGSTGPRACRASRSIRRCRRRPGPRTCRVEARCRHLLASARGSPPRVASQPPQLHELAPRPRATGSSPRARGEVLAAEHAPCSQIQRPCPPEGGRERRTVAARGRHREFSGVAPELSEGRGEGRPHLGAGLGSAPPA